jgi:putative ABC transport system permease protein
MLPLVLRGFAQRKLRVLLTAIAVALGVALMAGTYILTDTINHSFAGIFQTANRNKDVVITPTQTLGRGTSPETTPIDEAMVEKVRKTPGVAQAAGAIFSPATLLDEHRKRLTTGAAPAFVASESPPRFRSTTLARGRRPLTAGEVAIDEATASRVGLHIGQRLIVAGRAPARLYTIVGILQFGGGESFGGASVAELTLPEAQRVTAEPGHYDEIAVAAAPGVTPGVLRNRLRARLPGGVDVRTGAEEAHHDTVELEENLGFLRTFLLVFAYVALFVGAFIIFNTFSITVAQRTREFGLLRTLGGSRIQVMRAVLYEGLMLGALGAGLGLLGGIVLAPALDQLFKAFGADLPDNGTVLETRTIVVSLLVGVGVTVLSGLPPALRATRVPPLAAMREGVEIPRRTPLTRGRYAVPILLALIALRLVIDIAQGASAATIAITAAVGVLVLMVRLRQRARGSRYRVTRALAGAIGALVSWRGITGRLARENSVRQPGRTLTTAAALTIGIALVAFVAVLAAGTKATINHAISRSFAGNLIVENTRSSGEVGIPSALGSALRRVRGVATVTPVAFTVGRTPGSSSNVTITAIEPATFGRVYRVEWKHGSNASLAQLESGGTLATQKYASAHHLAVGSRLSVRTPTGARVSLRVSGIASSNTGQLLGALTISLSLAQSAFGLREDAFDFVSYARGASNAQVQPAVQRLLARDFPQTRSRTEAQFVQEQAGKVNTLLALIYVLLALSVIVSLFGIVNTLMLSVYERTRELGMMRAIGTSRRQVRQMIRYESLITALIGGVLGVLVGLVAAVLVTTLALSGSGYVQSFPVGTLLVLLVVAALAGLLAAQPPARRAARLDMLRALASE